MNSVYNWFQQTNKLYIALAFLIIVLAIYYIVTTRLQNKKTAERFSEERKMEEYPTVDKTRAATLSLYYTEWCGWSKKFLPEWEAFEKYASDNKLNLTLEKINCEKEGGKCTGIPHFPCVIITRANGEKGMMEDKFPRTTEGLINFASQSV